MKWKFVTCLKDYCTNCTVAGLSYIANHNLHFTERIFWLLCVALSAFGSYHLISEFRKDFESKAVSIVYDSLSLNSKVMFPSVAVCDMLNNNEVEQELEDYVTELDPEDYQYDVEAAILFGIYPHSYIAGFMKSRCLQFENCEKCAKCPRDGYRELQLRFGVNCSDYFVECSFSHRPFDCCRYFLPLITPYGRCFLLNSVQNNQRDSQNWLNILIDPSNDKGIMKLVAKRHMQIILMNEEDIPQNIIPNLHTSIEVAGQHKDIQIHIEHIINDVDVREVSHQYRQCRFPDEQLPYTRYKAYSFTTCLIDCIREIQLRLCNCTPYSTMPTNQGLDCGYHGYMCLENAGMVDPNPKLFLPWVNKYKCDCVPSCTEHDLNIIYESAHIDKNSKNRSVTIVLPVFPTKRYRRQALRTRLDIVVTIGGIMGLFLGASILSGIELLYYFTLRIYNSVKAEKKIIQTIK